MKKMKVGINGFGRIGRAIYRINHIRKLFDIVIINDKNGLDDIRYVRYQINIENMAAEDSCNYEPESGFLNYPQWFLEYKETTDAGFVFDVNNAYLAEPGIPIKPLNQCGTIGVSTFRFIIADMIFDPIIEDKLVGFDK